MSAICSTAELSPLALYVHWAFCREKCPYCDFNSHVRDHVEHSLWRNALLTELGYYAQLPGRRQLVSIFFGGGTPSLMEPQTVREIIETAATYWSFSPDIEITLEANPTSVEAGKLRDFRDCGINRISLGVQSLRDDALRFLGRRHNAREALSVLEMAGELFPRTTFDLIYARPEQSLQQWENELKQAIPYINGHVSLYQLTIEPGTQFYHRFNGGEFNLPDDDTAARMYERTQEIMESISLPAYEISNHAKAGEESRHNLIYWRGGDYVGIGAGAHSRYGLPADDPGKGTKPGGGKRIAASNLRSPEKWLAQVQTGGNGIAALEEQDCRTVAEERLLMGLRLREGVKKEHLSPLNMEEKISRLRRAGLVEDSAGYLRCTARGTLLLNRILETLF